MTTHEFYLAIDAPEMDEDDFYSFCERVHRTGCDDATPFAVCPKTYIHFLREADTEALAVKSAIDAVAKAGYTAIHAPEP